MSINGSGAPSRALLTAALAVVAIVVLWQLRFGAWSLLLVPVLALWVVNVHLGGGLNEPVFQVFERLRRRRAGR